jgi:hypothetical protein
MVNRSGGFVKVNEWLKEEPPPSKEGSGDDNQKHSGD